MPCVRSKEPAASTSSRTSPKASLEKHRSSPPGAASIWKSPGRLKSLSFSAPSSPGRPSAPQGARQSPVAAVSPSSVSVSAKYQYPSAASAPAEAISSVPARPPRDTPSELMPMAEPAEYTAPTVTESGSGTRKSSVQSTLSAPMYSVSGRYASMSAPEKEPSISLPPPQRSHSAA